MADEKVLGNAPDAIRNPIQIRSLLGKLVKQHSILSVTLEGFRRHGTSAVLAVDQPQGYMALDELVPARMHESIRPGTQLAIHTRLDNVDLRFNVQVAGIGTQDGIAMYRVRVPATVRYSQRRRAFRSRVGAGKPIHVSLHRPDSEFGFDGALLDLSVTGFGALVSPHELVEPGQEYLVKLPIGENVAMLPTVITFSSIDDNQRQRRIGGRFVGLGPEAQRTVTLFVSAIQREHLRKLRSLQAD